MLAGNAIIGRSGGLTAVINAFLAGIIEEARRVPQNMNVFGMKFGTDHTPGFASAALCNILNIMQAGYLARDMKKADRFVIYQTIGRDAGWLAAVTAMAKEDDDEAPHLIYTPEFVKLRKINVKL